MVRLLIIGGYGRFGGQVASLLADAPSLIIIIAGRSLARAERWCAGRTGQLEPARFDRDGDLAAQMAQLRPDIVLDASGPFQAYAAAPVVQACIDHGAHYLDLADGASFVAGITAFDAAARARGLVVLSGVSSFPEDAACSQRRCREALSARCW